MRYKWNDFASIVGGGKKDTKKGMSGVGRD
jgi:hypothetical protein